MRPWVQAGGMFAGMSGGMFVAGEGSGGGLTLAGDVG